MQAPAHGDPTQSLTGRLSAGIKDLWEKATLTTSEDVDDARREYITKVISLIIGLIGFGFFIIFLSGWVLGIVPADSAMIILIFSISLLGIWLLAMRGHWRAVGLVPPILVFIIAVYGNIIGGEGAPALAFYALGIIMAALIVGNWATWFMAAISIAAYTGIGIAHLNGYLLPKRTMETAFVNRIIIITTLYTAISALLWFLVRRYRLALAESHKTAELLTEHAIKLGESEERFRSLVNNIPDIVYAINEKGEILSVNEESLKIFGFRADEVLGRSFTDMVHPDDIHIPSEQFQVTLREHREYTSGIQFRIMDRSGNSHWVEVHSHARFDENGRFIQEEGVLRDITDRLKAQDALRENERQMKEVLQGTPFPMFVIGKDHRVIHWNSAMELYTGIPSSDIIGTGNHWKPFYTERRPTMADLIVDDAIELLPDWYSGRYRPSSHLKNAFEGTDRFTVKGRGEAWLTFTAAQIKDSDGNVIGAIESLEDITERHRAEEALKESEERFRSIFEYSRDAIIIVEPPSWRCARVNRTALDMFMTDEISITAMGLWNLASPIQPDGESSEARIKGMIDKAVSEGWCFFEWQCRRRDGSEFPATALLSRIEESGLTFLQATVRDITERKRAEEQIRATLREKEVLLREIHHRVKNNFQIITSLLNLQSRNITDSELLKLFEDSTNRIRAMALVHEKLYQSSNMAEIDFSSYLNTITQDLSETYGVIMERPGLVMDTEEIFLSIEQAVPCGLIVNELITNALKYAFPGGSPNGLISVMLRGGGGDTVTIRISDNGIGIPPEVDPEKTQTLGLQLVTLLTKQIHGRALLERKGGTTWTITFTASTPLGQARRT